MRVLRELDYRRWEHWLIAGAVFVGFAVITYDHSVYVWFGVIGVLCLFAAFLAAIVPRR